MAVRFNHNGIAAAPTNFYGNPASWAPTAAAYGSQANAQAQAHSANQSVNQQRLAGQAGILQTIYSQPGQFAGALAQAGGNSAQAAGYGAQGMGQAAQGMGQAAQGMGLAAQGYAGLGQGYGSIAQAMGNERSNFYGANAMAEAARQAGLANQGAAGLGAYGNASTAAQQTQAMQTTAYMKALSDMMAANQAGITGLGQANQSAVAGLGAAGQNALGGFGQASQGAAGAIGAAGQGAASKVGSAQMVTGALGGLLGGDGSFQATGVNGPIASGSYTGAGPGGFNFSSTTDASAIGMPREMMGNSLNDLAARDAAYRQQFAATQDQGMGQLERGHGANLGAMMGGNDAYRQQLGQGFFSQAGQPRAILNDSLRGIQGLMGQGMGAQNYGMNQFYATQNDPRNRGNYNPMLAGINQLGGQLGGAIGQIGGIAGQIGGVAGSIGNMARAGMRESGNTASSIMNLWERGLGGTGAFGGEGPLAHWLTGKRVA